MVPSLRNIVHLNCSLLNAHGEFPFFLFFSLYQVFATTTFKSKLLTFKPPPFQRAPNVTTVLSGPCTTSSLDFTISNPFPQHERPYKFLSRWSVSPSSPTRPYIITFRHSASYTTRARSTPPPLMTSASSSHSKAWKS